MAAGGSVEPFWEVYAVHKDNKEVFRMLEEYRIGNLKEEDVEKNDKESKRSSKVHDPFSNEPERCILSFVYQVVYLFSLYRHPSLLAVSERPFNAETPLPTLADSFLTPNELFYVRSHLATPDVKEEEYELEISAIGSKELTLTLSDLKKFPKHTVVAAIQCGGNRRKDMNDVKALKGLQWSGT